MSKLVFVKIRNEQGLDITLDIVSKWFFLLMNVLLGFFNQKPMVFKTIKLMNNPLVFITGITGFVGQNLNAYLTKDFNVKGISRQQSPLSLTYENYFNDKQEAVAMVHLAGKAHDLKKQKPICLIRSIYCQ